MAGSGLRIGRGEQAMPLPHLTRGGGRWIVPAGALDEPLGFRPDRHVEWASRADWYEQGDHLPTWDESLIGST